MTWTAAETPHAGDSPDDGLTGGPAGGAPGGSTGGAWVVEKLPPGALGADPAPAVTDGDGDDDGDDDGGLFGDLPPLPPLPLIGPLADALTTVRDGADAAAQAACYLASVGPDQRLEALGRAARARDVLDAVLLRLTATFTPEEVRALGATSVSDLLLTHTGASPQRAGTEVKLAAALTAASPLLQATETTATTDTTDESGAGCTDTSCTDTGCPSAGAAAPAAPGPTAGSSTVALGRLGAAHARGEVSTDIAALAVRTVADLPARLRRTHMAVADATVARLLPGKTHAQAATICLSLAHRLDPDRADRGFDPDDIDRRYLNTTTHSDGFVDVRARLDPVVGAEFTAAIEHLSKPDPTVDAPLADRPGDQPVLPGLDSTAGTTDGTADTDDGTAPSPGAPPRPGVQVRDERTAGQRRADALALLVRTGRASDHTRGGEGARVIVTTTADTLHGATGAGPAHCETTNRPLSTAALRTMACAGSLQAVVLSCSGADAEVLALGRAVRLFTAGQRRAMLARDGGCLIPGCTAPPGWLEAHHVHDWAGGGPTDVSNGVLLCTRHHVLVTLGTWAVRVVAGVPQVRPPRTVDPLRRWVLNPRRRLREDTTRLLDQLLLDPPGGQRDDPPDTGPRPSEPPGTPELPETPDIPSPRGTCAC